MEQSIKLSLTKEEKGQLARNINVRIDQLEDRMVVEAMDRNIAMIQDISNQIIVLRKVRQQL